MAMRWMQVTIDGCERTARALADPEDTWNGFIKPWFPLSAFGEINAMLDDAGTGERLLYEMRVVDERIERTAVVRRDGETVERFGAKRIDGLLLFPIGAGEWTWVDAKED